MIYSTLQKRLVQMEVSKGLTSEWSPYVGISKDCTEVVGRSLSLRSKRERVGDLERGVHRQAFRQVGATAIEHKIRQMCH